MTPECPKGPESEARPGFTKYERYDLTTWAYAAAHSIEVYEVDRSDGGFEDLERELLDAHELQNQGLAALLGLPGEADDGDIADEITRQRSEVERLTAEVERLRAQVGNQRAERVEADALLGRLSRRVLEALDLPVSPLRVDEIAAEVEKAQAEVSRLREQLAAQTVLPQDAEARVTALLERYWADVRDGKREDAGDDAEAEQAHEVVKLLRSWEVPSIEAKAPQGPIIHTVLLSSDTGVMGEWQAFCSGCEQGSKGDLAHAEFWKDQHLADVLVPTLTNESFISSQDEDATLFAVAMDRVRRDKGERHTLEDVAEELELLDGGRPSGSTAAAPQPSNLAVWVDDDEREFDVRIIDIRQIATIRLEDGEIRNVLLHELQPRQDAAQAAGSEATPEETPDEAFVGAPYHEHPAFHAPVSHMPPSPSLRKEGEDR